MPPNDNSKNVKAQGIMQQTETIMVQQKRGTLKKRVSSWRGGQLGQATGYAKTD
jgi:hypothetical protein